MRRSRPQQEEGREQSVNDRNAIDDVAISTEREGSVRYMLASPALEDAEDYRSDLKK